MLFELAGKSTAISEGTAEYREREPFPPPHDIYEQSTDELVARATEFSLRKNITVSALWSEYITSQDKTAQQESSSIERTISIFMPPLGEIELQIFRGGSKCSVLLPSPPEGELRLDAIWRRRADVQQKSISKGIH